MINKEVHLVKHPGIHVMKTDGIVTDAGESLKI